MTSIDSETIITSDLKSINSLSSNKMLSITLTALLGNESQVKNDFLPIITLEETSNHDNITDCWIVLYDRVYDVTEFLNMHPGGYDVILDHAGRDATIAFRGTGHSKQALAMLKDYLIGELPAKQKIFHKGKGGLLLSNIPK